MYFTTLFVKGMWNIAYKLTNDNSCLKEYKESVVKTELTHDALGCVSIQSRTCDSLAFVDWLLFSRVDLPLDVSRANAPFHRRGFASERFLGRRLDQLKLKCNYCWANFAILSRWIDRVAQSRIASRVYKLQHEIATRIAIQTRCIVVSRMLPSFYGINCSNSKTTNETLHWSEIT